MAIGPMKETSLRGDGEVNAAAAPHRRFRQRGRQRNEVCGRKEKGGEVDWEVIGPFAKPHPPSFLSVLAWHSLQHCHQLQPAISF